MGWYQADPIVFGPYDAVPTDCGKPCPEDPLLVCGLPSNHADFEMMCGHWVRPIDPRRRDQYELVS